MEVDVDWSQGESAQRKISKRKVIRVESEETQDYVCGMMAISREEAEEDGLWCQAPLVNHESHLLV